MIRRKYSVSLRRATVGGAEDVNPNSFLTNIADCMLVLMLGLLVALISHYGIALNEDEQIMGVQVNMDENSDGAIDEQYQQAGTVYYDSATGQYYLVKE